MADIKTVRISGLTEKTTYGDSDYIVMGGDDAYKMQAGKMATQVVSGVKGTAESAVTIANAADAAAEAAQSLASDAIVTANKATQSASDANTVATEAKSLATDANTTATTASQNASEAKTTAEEAKQSASDAKADCEDIKAYLGYSNEEIVGLQVDYENKTFQRLAGAYNLSAGADFDKFPMYGGRRRCTVADDGTITSWYGDDNYAEDGSMGQVMVYQPKFYYKVVPLKLEAQTDGMGYHLRKANYYVSATKKTGFKLHPAFIDASGNEVDYIMLSAYEGILWDADGGADGTGAWLVDDQNYKAKTINTSADKLGSVAGCQPVSYITRANFETIAKNRGTGWHSDLIKAESANQMLIIIEMGMMNLQTAIANGVVSITNNSAYNCSCLTGSTSSIGNGTGQANSTTDYTGTVQTANGKTSITYRGIENLWGNIWKFVYGINIYGNGSQKGGIPYICTDFNFVENKNSGNYESAGFTLANASGYISAMGYGSEDYDWLFEPSETTGNSSIPVGDYFYVSTNLNGYKIVFCGGSLDSYLAAGVFCWYMSNSASGRTQGIGDRLVYIPTKGSDTYTANIASWQAQMSK